MLVSDITIIPVVPSDADIAVLNKMISLINQINQLRVFSTPLKVFIVISKASPNPALKQKVDVLKELINEKKAENIFLLESVIYEREAYKNAFSAGKGVLEFCKETDKAYEDFNSFFDEIVAKATKDDQ